MRLSPSIFTLPLAALALCIGKSEAAAIFSDEFITGGAPNYNSAANLNGQNPTVYGATSAWGSVGTSQWRTQDVNLTVAGVTNGGGSLKFALGNNVTGSSAQNRGFTAADSMVSSLWFGGIFQANTPGALSGVSTMAGFSNAALPNNTTNTASGATWSTANGGNLQGFGFGIRDGVLAVDYQSDISQPSSSRTITQVNTSFSMADGAAYFLVARVDFDSAGVELLNIWALTSAPVNMSLLGAATYSVSANFFSEISALDTLNVYAGKNGTSGANVNAIDALRIGTDYADLLVAVPEPSTWALLGVGLMAIMLGNRRRSLS